MVKFRDASFGPAVELATIDIPKMYQVQPRPNLLQRLGNFFAQPGPKPLKTEITYRGKYASSMMASTLKRIGEYREDPLDFSTADLMRHHPVVKLGTVARAATPLTMLREAQVKCDDRRIMEFVKSVFIEEWLLRVAESSIMPSYVYGCAPHEKVWESKPLRIVYTDDDGQEAVAYDGPGLIYKKVKFVHPVTLDRFLLQDGTQDFDGFVQKPPPGAAEKPVEAWKAFLYVNRFLFGGLWGESEYRDVYPHWYYSEFFRALLADYLRYKAVPPIIGHAPVGVREDQDGNEVDNLTIAGETLEKAYSSLVVMLPDERDDRGNMRWGFEEMKVSEHGEIYARALEDLHIDILRGLLVPERTITQDRAAVGSYNQAEVHAERLIDMAKMEVDGFLRYVNLYLIPQLVQDHFGQDTPTCTIYTTTVSQELKAKLTTVVMTILQNDRFGVWSQQVAFRQLLEFLNIPFTTGLSQMPEPLVPKPVEEEDEGEDSEKGEEKA